MIRVISGPLIAQHNASIGAISVLRKFASKLQAEAGATPSNQTTSSEKTAAKSCGSTKSAAVGGKAPLGKFDQELFDLEVAIAAQKIKKHPIAEEEPLQPHPNNCNPETGEIGGPRGPEPTRYGDWERKGRCIDF